MAGFAIPARNNLAKRSFTFTELLLVISITAVLTVIAIPQLKRTFDNLELDNFVKDVYYLANYLHSVSVAENNIYLLHIDQDSGKIWAEYQLGGSFKVLSGRLGRIYNAPSGTKIILDGADKIYFYPDGSVNNSKIVFSNKQNSEHTVEIGGLIAEIKIY
jgi:Tfp pilus assembly protein FimT